MLAKTPGSRRAMVLAAAGGRPRPPWAQDTPRQQPPWAHDPPQPRLQRPQQPQKMQFQRPYPLQSPPAAPQRRPWTPVAQNPAQRPPLKTPQPQLQRRPKTPVAPSVAAAAAGRYMNYRPPPTAAPKTAWSRARPASPRGEPQETVTFPTNRRVAAVLREIGQTEDAAGNQSKAVVFFSAAKKISALGAELCDAAELANVPGFGESLRSLIGDILSKSDAPRARYAKQYSIMFNVLRSLPAFDTAAEWQPVSKHIDFALPTPMPADEMEKLSARAQRAILAALRYGDQFIQPFTESELRIVEMFFGRAVQALDPQLRCALGGPARRGVLQPAGFVPLLVSHRQLLDVNDDAAQAFEKHLAPLVAALQSQGFVIDIWDTNPLALRANVLFRLKPLPGPDAQPWPVRRLQLQLVPNNAFVAALVHATGDDGFWSFMVQTALNKGYALGPDGLRRLTGTGKARTQSDPLPLESEQQLFELLGVRYFAPHERQRSAPTPTAFASRRFSRQSPRALN